MTDRSNTWPRGGVSTEQLLERWAALDRGWKAAAFGVLIVAGHAL
ncbi:hypothetical protein ACFQJ5_05310 [Halomicroarcula sp. GCM10025324]|nr:hypothetical protein [Halomicroarcula sp. ZS-22-S1]